MQTTKRRNYQCRPGEPNRQPFAPAPPRAWPRKGEKVGWGGEKAVISPAPLPLVPAAHLVRPRAKEAVSETPESQRLRAASRSCAHSVRTAPAPLHAPRRPFTTRAEATRPPGSPGGGANLAPPSCSSTPAADSRRRRQYPSRSGAGVTEVFKGPGADRRGQPRRGRFRGVAGTSRSMMGRQREGDES